MKKSIITCCLSILATLSFAQQASRQIRGTVVDTSDKPIGAVVVVLQAQDSTYLSSTLTDSDGKFIFQSSENTYMLLFQHVAYEPFIANGSGEDAGQIVLTEKQNAISEVIISAERPLVKVEDGKLIYNSSKLQAGKVANTAYDIMKQVPGVIENNGTVSLSGANSLTIIINGRPTTLSVQQMSDLLHTIPADRVKDIEVMYNVPPQYHVRGAAINVTLKSNLANVTSGEIFGEYKFKHKSSWTGGGNLLFSTPKLSGDIIYSYSALDDISNIDLTAAHLLHGQIYDINQHQLIEGERQQHDIRAGLDYAISDENKMSFVYTSSISPNTHSLTSGIGNFVNSSSKKDGDNALHNLALNYSLKDKLSVGIDYTNYHLNNTQTMNHSGELETPDFTSSASQKINNIGAYLDHSVSVGNNWGLKYGASFNFAQSADTQIYVSGNADLSSQNTESTINEYTYDLYAGFDKNFSKGVSLSAYLTGEYYKRNGYGKWSLFPQMSLTYVINPTHILQFAISSDKIYPSYWAMQESVSYIDGYSQLHGNPNLTPMYNYQGVAMYIYKQKYIVQLYYSYTSDYFQQSAYQSQDELALIYKTLNWDYYRHYGLNVILPFKVGKWWDSRITLVGTNTKIKSHDFYNMEITRDKWIGRIQMSNSFIVCNKPTISFDVSGYYQTPAIQCTYDLSSSWALNAGLKCAFLKDKLSCSIMCNDIFESASPKIKVDMQNQNFKMLTDKYTRSITIRLSYKIGGYKQKDREAIDTSRFGH